MINVNIKMENLVGALGILSEVPALLEVAAEDVAKTLRNLVVGRTPVQTGETKRAWTNVSKETGGYSFGNPLDHIITLEEGLYPEPHPGGRTIKVGGKVYSRQAPGGIIKPILEDPDVLAKVANMVVTLVMEGLKKYA